VAATFTLSTKAFSCGQKWRQFDLNPVYPTARYTNNAFPNDTELALGMTLLESLQYILQVFCVRQEDRGGVNRGSQRHSKSEEFWMRSQGNWRPRC